MWASSSRGQMGVCLSSFSRDPHLRPPPLLSTWRSQQALPPAVYTEEVFQLRAHPSALAGVQTAHGVSLVLPELPCSSLSCCP